MTSCRTACCPMIWAMWAQRHALNLNNAHLQAVWPFHFLRRCSPNVPWKCCACFYCKPIHHYSCIPQFDRFKGWPPTHRFDFCYFCISPFSWAAFTVRLVLATCNAISLVVIRKAVSNRFGSGTASCFTLLTCSQFHLLFWMGRTLPNMFAMPLSMFLFILSLEQSNVIFVFDIAQSTWLSLMPQCTTAAAIRSGFPRNLGN